MGNQLVERLSEIIQANITYSFLILYLTAVFTVFGVQLFLKKDSDTNNININDEDVTETLEKSIFVEIAGAVNEPGVYELLPESRLAEAINKADGFSKDASEEWVSKYINLSGKLSDSQKFYIPFKWDSAITAASEHDVAVLKSPAAINQPVPISIQTNASVLEEVSSGKVNVNTASEEDIDALSGIGPVYAARIIENRPYDDFQVFVESSGIPKNVLEKIKDQIGF